MPVNSSRFNRFLVLLLGQYMLATMAFGQAFELTDADLQWLGERVFANECASKYDCLTSWNEGEDFPSLGIGHFIWFQAGQDSPFEETFPALLQYFEERNVETPGWLNNNANPESPWRNREEFYTDFNSERSIQLRTFLDRTKAIQVDFIVRRLGQSLEQIITSFSTDQQTSVRELITTVARSHPPYGAYALIDYVHFKGTGLKSSERYQNQGWGLKHVIDKMQGSPITLYSFVQAAKQVLGDRVINAPVARNEQRWLVGWHNRVASYLPPH
ncbi:MAG: hypothetical protein GKR91_04590 [Pseudomonadales bacterium]|nr:hypothetical protein [Pseudomonadales bacterium]